MCREIAYHGFESSITAEAPTVILQLDAPLLAQVREQVFPQTLVRQAVGGEEGGQLGEEGGLAVGVQDRVAHALCDVVSSLGHTPTRQWRPGAGMLGLYIGKEACLSSHSSPAWWVVGGEDDVTGASGSASHMPRASVSLIRNFRMQK